MSHHFVTAAQNVDLLKVFVIFTLTAQPVWERCEIQWVIRKQELAITLFAICFPAIRCYHILCTGPLRTITFFLWSVLITHFWVLPLLKGQPGHSLQHFRESIDYRPLTWSLWSLIYTFTFIIITLKVRLKPVT